MNRKLKLKQILNVLSPDGTQVDFAEFDSAIGKLKDGLKQKVQAKTLDDVNAQLDAFRKRVDLAPLQQAIRNLETKTEERTKNLVTILDEEVSKFETLSQGNDGLRKQEIEGATGNIDKLRFDLDSLTLQKDGEVKKITDQLASLPDYGKQIEATFSTVQARVDELSRRKYATPEEITSLTDTLEALRKDLTNRINNIPRGGGSMNRNIAIGGNVTALSPFTDINLKAGANVTITYAANQVTGYMDVTIAATGGGGGGGITRSVNTVAISTLAGSVATTDYVYLCSGTITLTLPTSVGNSNLYTVKNIGAGIVTINTTGGETIDGGSTIIMPVQFTSVDLISNNSGNWDVT